MPGYIVQSGDTRGVPWQTYTGPGGPGIYIDINTKPHKFPGVPTYSAALYGGAAHWNTTGVTSIYDATSSGFRVYLRHPDNSSLTPADAAANGWYVRWVGTYISYAYPQ